MFKEALGSWFLKKCFDAAVERVSHVYQSMGAKLSSSVTDFQVALSGHFDVIDNWSAEVAIFEPQAAKSLSRIYVHLDCYLEPRRQRYDVGRSLTATPLWNIFSLDCRHFVVLGQPGAGKTTSMKCLCHRLLHEETFLDHRFKCPILIRFRELFADLNVPRKRGIGGDKTLVPRLINRVFDALGMKLTLPSGIDDSDRLAEIGQNLRLGTVVRFLDELGALLILDGFDEIPTGEARGLTIEEIRQLAGSLTQASIVVTSRTGEFPYLIDRCRAFEICLLTPDRVREFADKWLGSNAEAQVFMDGLMGSPYADTAIKPLTLAHLCAIFEKEGRIPEKPKTVYRKILSLSIAEWSAVNSVRRETRFSGFEPDRKYEFLARIAFSLSTGRYGTVFSSDRLISIYKTCCADFSLPPTEVKDVVQELEGQTGLFLQCGAESYEFVHKSLQEFLTAEYLVKLPKIPQDPRSLLRLPNELAIATTISSNPSHYFCELVFTRFASLRIDYHFIAAFVTRLIQERPDFNREANVVIAALALYSAYLRNGPISVSNEQLQLLYFDDNVREFERLLRGLLKSNRTDVLSPRYEKQAEESTADGGVVVRLRKKQRAPSLRYGYPLPQTLLCRRELYDEITLDTRNVDLLSNSRPLTSEETDGSP